MLDEFSRWMTDELDFDLELRNLTRMGELACESRVMRVPRPYPELSGPRVLTEELLVGTSFLDLLRTVRVDGRKGVAKVESSLSKQARLA